jgi:hypothetical protein
MSEVLSTETKFPDEGILPDDYPVYGDYLYVADGKLYRSDWHGINVRQLRNREGFKEVRRCNIEARRQHYEARGGSSNEGE